MVCLVQWSKWVGVGWTHFCRCLVRSREGWVQPERRICSPDAGRSGPPKTSGPPRPRWTPSPLRVGPPGPARAEREEHRQAWRRRRGSQPVNAAQAAAVEHGAEAGVVAGRVEVGEPRAARARGEEGAGRRQTRGAGRAGAGRRQSREPAVAVARLAELVERRQRVGGRR